MSSLSITRSIASKPSTGNRRKTVEVEIEIEIAPADLCWIDGFITAVAIGPEKIPQHEWLASIGLVEEREDDLPIAANGTGMLVKLHDKVLNDLRRSPDLYAPVLGASLAGPRLGLAAEWSAGFLDGIRLRPASWKSLNDTPGGRSLLNPILALFRDDDGQNPAFDVEAFAEKRGTTVESILNEAVGLLPGSVCGIYTYWRSHDRRHRKSASEFLTGKVGRNDPCPCGSGMKYKKCCLN